MTLPFDPDKFDPAKVDGSKVPIQDITKPLRIPDPKDFDPNADASDWPIKDITQPGRAVQIIGGVRKPLPDGKDFDPKKVPVDRSLGRNITKEVVAQRGGIQIIGGVRPPASPELIDAETAAKYAKLLGITAEEFAKLLEQCRVREGALLTPARLKALVEFDATNGGLKFIGQSREAMNFGEYENSLKYADQAVAVFRELTEAGAAEATQHLADALAERGKALSRLNRHAEALACFDEALALEQRVRDQRRDVELSLAHADTFADKGLALSNAGRREEGAACYQTALTVYRRGWSNGEDEAGRGVAITLFNIGESERSAGRFPEAIASYDEALEIHNRRSKGQCRDAVVVLTGKSKALYGLNEFEAALLAARTAISILESLIVNESVKLDLSTAVLWHGRALERLCRLMEASACYKRSTELVHEVKRKRGTFQEPAEQ